MRVAGRFTMALLAAALFTASLVACRDPARAAGTAALVETTFDPAFGIEQLGFEVRNEAGDVLDQATLPETADGPLASPQSIRWLLPDSLAGSNLTVSVQGFASRELVAQASATEEIVKGYEVTFVVDLGHPETLDGGSCGPSNFSACGLSGTCVACNELRADHCENGACRCGDGNACVAGQRCSGGMCVCDAESCPSGCCENGTKCQTARSVSSCGPAGESCFACSGDTADNCSMSGECKCGQNAACATYQRCSGGACICDSSSCPDGCCSSLNECLKGDSNLACGTKGEACQQCNNFLACIGGSCI